MAFPRVRCLIHCTRDRSPRHTPCNSPAVVAKVPRGGSCGILAFSSMMLSAPTACAGTRNSGIVPVDDPNTGLVAPEVALTLPGCSGAEARLLDCPGDEGTPAIVVGRQCRSAFFPGLQVACVSAPDAGATHLAPKLRQASGSGCWAKPPNMLWPDNATTCKRAKRFEGMLCFFYTNDSNALAEGAQ